MSSDPIADMLTSIRNGGAARQRNVEVPLSKIKLDVLGILKDNNFIEDFSVEDKKIRIVLKYFEKDFAIISIKRISKPGVRIYSKKKKLPKALSGYGITIVSTSQGVMTDKQAKLKNLGGEVLCQVY